MRDPFCRDVSAALDPEEIGRMNSGGTTLAAATDVGDEDSSRERERALLPDTLRDADRLAIVARLGSEIAHELGTPLNVVSGRARMICQENEDAEAVRKNAEIIIEQTQRMAGLIRKLLRFAERRLPPAEVISVGSQIQRAIRLSRPAADARGVQVEMAEEAEALAHTRAQSVLQVLTNLIRHGVLAMQNEDLLVVGGYRTHVPEPPDRRALPGDYIVLYVEHRSPASYPDLFFEGRVPDPDGCLCLAVCHEVAREELGWVSRESLSDGRARISVHLFVGEP